MTFEIIITLVTLSGILFALVRDIARPDFIFLGGLVVLLLFGVLTPAQAFSGFANEAVFTVGALFIVASGVQKTRALGFIEKAMFNEKASIRSIMMRMMASTSVMSAFLNNTPIVAMLIPQVQQWADRTGRSASSLLIPLSYAAIVGGVVTLIGTSTNLIVSGMLVDRGYEPLGLFELSWIGVPAVLALLLYFYLIGYKWLPENNIKDENTLNSSPSGYQFDLRIPVESDIAGKSVDEAGLRSLENLFLIHVHRKNQILGPVEPHFILENGDVLTFIGEIKYADDLAVQKGLDRAVPLLDQSSLALPLYEAVLTSSSSLVGKTLKESEFRENFRAVIIGIQRRDETIKGALGNIPLKAGDLLLIEAKHGFDKIYNHDKENFYLVTKKGERNLQISEKAPIALGITIAMIAIAAFGWLPIVVSALTAAILMVLTGCVQKGKVIDSIHLPILILIASAIGFGQAIDSTGIAQISGTGLMSLAGGFGVVAVIISLYIITNIFTELITNNAAAVLMVPIALASAVEAGLDSHAAAITVAIAASASFLTPIGYQTNLMVMGPGGYKFTDFVKVGFPVTIIMILITVVIVMWRYG